MKRGLFMPQWGFDTDAEDSFVTVPIDEAPDARPVNVPLDQRVVGHGSRITVPYSYRTCEVKRT